LIKKAVGHSGIEKGGDNPAMDDSVVPLQPRIGPEHRSGHAVIA